MLRVLPILTLSLFASFSGFAQSSMIAAPAEGKLIVRFRVKPDAASFRERLGNRFSLGKALVADWYIYSVSYNASLLSEEEALRQLNSLSQVEVSQVDHRLSLRNAPNDPKFNMQWQYDKMQAQKAWNITTGGTTRNNDTIVIAVVDDGINPKYEDLKDNLWKNRHEIPKNGIDDDGNGYVDDYNGWNFYRNNDTLVEPQAYDVRSHGTSVAGVIGAKGNNGKGITGVNWDVKMMPVIFVDEGQSTPIAAYESKVVEAYAYVLKQRKMYNESNGALGAYVVATNSSWGYDLAFGPAAPIWCAMYDSLGHYGIMNCGATSNSNINVDAQGDLPSTCPSEHLIVVTSTNINDNYSGGYGITHVDLGAPGGNVYTTIDDPVLYDYENGTSFACPQVAGFVGLLYASACQKFLILAKEDPEEANMLIREFILKGVDENASLTGRSTTSGRINFVKSLKRMSDWCFDVSVKHPAAKPDVSVYPNPSTGEVNIVSFVSEPCMLSLTDVSGKEVYSRNLDFSSNPEALLNMSLPAGVYHLQCLFKSQQQYNTKLVVIN